ncbi:transposable element Tcb2 transposase [Trichonephila clavipes]|nr:transposable element Tcb2 transposase [Trichonephila clavipes]
MLNLNIAFPSTPTRFGHNSANTIDIALIKNFYYPFTINSIDDLSSDHNPVFLNFNFKLAEAPPNPRAVSTDWNAFKINLNKNISLFDFHPNNINNTNDLEQKITEFTEAVIDTHSHASRPIETDRRNFTPHNINQLIKIKNYFRKRYHQTLNPIFKSHYNRAQSDLKKKLKKYNDIIWQKRLEALNTADNSLWRTQKFFKNKRPKIPPLNCATGTAVTDQQKANLLATNIKNNFVENDREDDNYKQNDDLINTTKPLVCPKIIGRFRSDGLIENKSGRGRKSILSDVAKRKVLKDIKIDPKLSAVNLAAETSRIMGRSVSAETVRNVIRHDVYSSLVARKKPFINLQNQKKRLEFAKTHQLKTFGRKLYLVTKVNSTFLEVMAIAPFGESRTPLWIQKIYVLQLNMVVAPSWKTTTPSIRHVMLKCGLFHCKQQFHTPPQSPDINIIENLWPTLETAVQKHQIRNKAHLKQVLQEEWDKISPDTTKKLVESVPRRLEDIIKAKGHATKYQHCLCM